MSQFIQRVANYIANEVLIKGLANSKTFQRFAVRTDATIKESKKVAEEKLNSTLDDVLKKAAAAEKNASTTANNSSSGPPQPPLRGFPGFLSAFGKEVRKDLGIGQ